MQDLDRVIPTGRANAIHQQELANRLSCSTTEVKKQVQAARRQGVAIMSGSCGYWMAENDHEKKMFTNLMEKQAKTRLYSIKAIKRSLNEIQGQISLFESDTRAGEGVSDS